MPRTRSGVGALALALVSMLLLVPEATSQSGGASAPDEATSAAASGTAPAVVAELSTRRVLFAGPRPQRLTLTVPGTGTAPVVVDLVRRGSLSPVARWDLGAVARGAEHVVEWDGADDGRGARDGEYRFRVSVDGGQPAPVAETFRFHRAFFPVRGPHEYGDGPGAGRGHQGVDILAACGTPLLAARGGRVEKSEFHGAAGHHVVIDVVGTESDMVYMHLDGPPLVKAGEEVHTGQRLGDVGTSGRSSACHLHFELWSAPGYFTGGRPIDATRQLRRWDEETGGDREVRRR